MATKIEYTPMRIIQTSKENAEKLLAGESITTAEGEVITFGMNDILVTPDDTVAKVSGLDNRVTALENATAPEIDTSKLVTTDTAQAITGTKTFDIIEAAEAYFSSTIYITNSVDGYITHENNGLLVNIADGTMHAYTESSEVFYRGTGIDVEWTDDGYDTVNLYSLNFPKKGDGTYTLATTDDCKKLYRHYITLSGSGISAWLIFISSQSVPFTDINNILLSGDHIGGTYLNDSNVCVPISIIPDDIVGIGDNIYHPSMISISDNVTEL